MKILLIVPLLTFNLFLRAAETQPLLDKQKIIKIANSLINYEEDIGYTPFFFLTIADSNEDLAQDYSNLYFSNKERNISEKIADFCKKWNIPQGEIHEHY